MSNFTKKKFVHILHRQSFFKGKLKMQGNYCISAGDSKLSVEMLVIDEIVPTLLHALEDDETSDTALDGLKQILRLGANRPVVGNGRVAGLQSKPEMSLFLVQGSGKEFSSPVQGCGRRWVRVLYPFAFVRQWRGQNLIKNNERMSATLVTKHFIETTIKNVCHVKVYIYRYYQR
ncbi:uncharacterized protein HKW66_Vig0004100 [Vigna angularis]|uniref:Uncharacterized protein n=1 Tax=Phaseolus angularis TaxID=3914 RepID=A0A8T0LHN7_PHAAN|nr:uncharacterized protein HKW66_Vig0004100 [Vigna angularis]